MSYFGVLRGFIRHRDLASRRSGLGAVAPVWDDVSSPTALAWFTADFSQRGRAFDLEAGRKAMREIIGMYFAGASFFRTTGLYEKVESGGLAAMVFGLMPSDPREAAQELVLFKETVRACAKQLAIFFEQDSVAAVVQAPDGHISVRFVPKNEDVDISRFIRNKADYAKILRMQTRIRRLERPRVYGD